MTHATITAIRRIQRQSQSVSAQSAFRHGVSRPIGGLDLPEHFNRVDPTLMMGSMGPSGLELTGRSGTIKAGSSVSSGVTVNQQGIRIAGGTFGAPHLDFMTSAWAPKASMFYKSSDDSFNIYMRDNVDLVIRLSSGSILPSNKESIGSASSPWANMHVDNWVGMTLQFDADEDGTVPAGTLRAIYADNTDELLYNVPTNGDHLIQVNANTKYHLDENAIWPETDNAYDLGRAANQWDIVYAAAISFEDDHAVLSGRGIWGDGGFGIWHNTEENGTHRFFIDSTNTVEFEAVATQIHQKLQIDGTETAVNTGEGKVEVYGTMITNNSGTSTANDISGLYLYAGFSAPNTIDVDHAHQVRIAPPTMAVSGGGAVDRLTTLWIEGIPTSGATSNYGLWVDASLTRLDGDGTHILEVPSDNTDPTSGGGAATGRIPISIGGATRYIPYYT